MNTTVALLLSAALGLSIVLACGADGPSVDVPKLSTSPLPHGQIAFVDLDRLAKETGLNFEYQTNLAALRGDLEQRLKTTRERLTEDARRLVAELPAATQPEDRARIQAAIAAKERELRETANSLQTELNKFNQAMQTQFRAQLQPAMKKVSDAHGQVAILVRDLGVGYVPPGMDLTDELIAELKANPIKLPTTLPD